ncbi:DUF6243 family protein [Streptomyces ovatisporus]|uniref:DUF6243 family protein n=1 Tax=Streptomyces ovatisporus TaxID=1128682 RepID=A0ABV9A1U0_9ACTN
MGKGRSGKMLGVGGARAHLSREQLRGAQGASDGAGLPDARARSQKRELLRRLQESRGNGSGTRKDRRTDGQTG